MEFRDFSATNESIIEKTSRPFVLSLSKHERCGDAPFDKLRVNGDWLIEEPRGSRRFSEEYVFSIMDPLVSVLKGIRSDNSVR